MERTLDARPSLDPRNADYPVQLTAVHPRSYTWRVPYWLDQGREGACAGFARAHEIGAYPVTYPVAESLAQRIYRRAQQIDEWPGEGYDGTSVVAAQKAAIEMGFYASGSYTWASSMREGQVAVSYKGPAVIGIPMYTGMMDADADGYLHPTGVIEGWHSLLWHSVSTTLKDNGLHNSWGQDWGWKGRARMHDEEFAVVVEHPHADICISSGRKRPA